MNELYVMDACALIAFLREEEGAELVTDILKSAEKGTTQIIMNIINLLEVYYDMYRSIGKTKAAEKLALIRKLPITSSQKLTTMFLKKLDG